MEGTANLTKECFDLLEGLLDPDQDSRFGSTEVDSEAMHNLRVHPWFKVIDWEQLQSGQQAGPLGEKSASILAEVCDDAHDGIFLSVYLSIAIFGVFTF